MAKNAIYTLGLRRKREGKTNYKKRLELLKGGKTRLVIRRSNTAVIIQFANYDSNGDVVLTTFHSHKLESFGWNYSKKSLPACYLAGLAAGVMAKKKGVTHAILDLGLQTPLAGTKVYAALKGVIDAGIQVPSSKDIFPSQERLFGKHIEQNNATTFSGYAKKKLDKTKITQTVDGVKQKIIS